MEFTRQEQFDAYVELILAVRQKGTTQEGEAGERRKKKSPRKAAALEWARKRLEAQRAKDGRCKPKTMTKEDVAAAAVYRAKAEEARRNHERSEEFDAVIKWIGTGDPEAIRISNQWVDENMEAMKLEAPDPTKF